MNEKLRDIEKMMHSDLELLEDKREYASPSFTLVMMTADVITTSSSRSENYDPGLEDGWGNDMDW